ncbi:MAG TPA: response regulator [Candidatus Nanoarchaeia archaeon]|nr:response regulator [Candidatus Nanoarchaeia archaeon]
MKNIFIIEDDITLAGAMRTQFNAFGFNAEINRGSEEDIEALINEIKKVDADIVILDLILPKLDGFEIIKKIREDEEISDIYIFIFTDVSDEDSKARGLRMGANQYFIKEDFSPEEFAEKVKRIMENRDAMEKSEGNTYQV